MPKRRNVTSWCHRHQWTLTTRLIHNYCLQDSCVILACGFDRNGKWLAFCESHNAMTWCYDMPHYNITSYSLNDVMTSHGDRCCRQRYSVNNRLIYLYLNFIDSHFISGHTLNRSLDILNWTASYVLINLIYMSNKRITFYQFIIQYHVYQTKLINESDIIFEQIFCHVLCYIYFMDQLWNFCNNWIKNPNINYVIIGG